MSAPPDIKGFSEIAVVIDDGFLSPPLESIGDDDWAALRKNSQSGAWLEVQQQHLTQIGKLMDLKRDPAALQQAWILYVSSPESFAIFDPIFKQVLANKDLAVKPLREAISFLEDELKLTVRKHHSVQSAIEDIKTSKLIFLDFYLKAASSIDEVIASIAENALAFQTDQGGAQERLLFLVSTNLPEPADIDKFRKAVRIRGAFFRPVRKQNLTRHWLSRELTSRIGRYDDMRCLANYLDVFADQISRSAEELRGHMDSLELHDLAILDNMRLSVESESLGNYMSWLFSEALATKIRTSSPLLKASSEVSRLNRPPFQGTLSPNQVLFDLYSQVSFTSTDSIATSDKVHFGDVLRVECILETASEKNQLVTNSLPHAIAVDGSGNESDLTGNSQSVNTVAVGVPAPSVPEQANSPDDSSDKSPAGKTEEIQPPLGEVASKSATTELLLVISPACDLQRCKPGYDVLCVRGQMSARTANLGDFLGINLGKDAELIRHLLKHDDATSQGYSLAEWLVKKIVTVAAKDLLVNRRYTKVARLNELFCHEVKEEALRHLGRVGIPVDPSFSSALSVRICLRRGKGKANTSEFSSNDSAFVAGILTAGNSKNEPRITLSEEFLDWLDQTISEFQEGGTADNQAKLISISNALREERDGIELAKSNAKEYKNLGTVRYVDELLVGAQDLAPNCFVFYPRGKVRIISQGASSVAPAPVAPDAPLPVAPVPIAPDAPLPVAPVPIAPDAPVPVAPVLIASDAPVPVALVDPTETSK